MTKAPNIELSVDAIKKAADLEYKSYLCYLLEVVKSNIVAHVSHIDHNFSLPKIIKLEYLGRSKARDEVGKIVADIVSKEINEGGWSTYTSCKVRYVYTKSIWRIHPYLKLVCV